VRPWLLRILSQQLDSTPLSGARNLLNPIWMNKPGTTEFGNTVWTRILARDAISQACPRIKQGLTYETASFLTSLLILAACDVPFVPLI
jgi:hypothetical protein